MKEAKLLSESNQTVLAGMTLAQHPKPAGKNLEGGRNEKHSSLP